MSGSLGGESQQSGSSTTTSTQPYIMSGPTIQAANSAAQAQIAAAQQASAAVTQNTTSAISALMNEYGTALQLQQPTIQMGNQAEAQLNYMLGLPAVAPGTAPTAPTAPTLNTGNLNSLYSEASGLLPQLNAINNLPANLALGSNPGQQTPGSYANNYAEIAGVANQLTSGGVPGQGPNSTNMADTAFLNAYANAGGTPGMTGADFQAAIANNPTNQAAQAQYQQAQQTYQQQLDAYNSQQQLYNNYSAKGTLSPSDISNVVNNLPGFAYDQSQGISTIQNAASASGMLNSGNILQGLNEFGQKLSQTYYQNYLNNLSGMAGLGQTATTNAANGANTLGANLASAYTNQGAGQANAALAAGQAAASSYLLPVANQQVVMTPYTTTSNTDSSSSSSSGGLSGVGGLLSGLSSVSSAGGFGKVLGGLA